MSDPIVDKIVAKLYGDDEPMKREAETTREDRAEAYVRQLDPEGLGDGGRLTFDEVAAFATTEAEAASSAAVAAERERIADELEKRFPIYQYVSQRKLLGEFIRELRGGSR